MMIVMNKLLGSSFSLTDSHPRAHALSPSHSHTHSHTHTPSHTHTIYIHVDTQPHWPTRMQQLDTHTDTHRHWHRRTRTNTAAPLCHMCIFVFCVSECVRVSASVCECVSMNVSVIVCVRMCMRVDPQPSASCHQQLSSILQ